jgi:hypothetical protein
MIDQSADVSAQARTLIGALEGDAELLEQLKALALAHETEFASCAGVWAPGLYERNPTFFGPFLVAYLDAKQEPTIKALLARAEVDGHDALFADLYQKFRDEKSWNADVARLARARLSDEETLQALQRRENPRASWRLSEAVALALYRRNPERFGEFVRAHVQRGWSRRPERYRRLRREARARGDDTFYWALFRDYASDDEWRASVHQLLASKPPASALIEELDKRQPTRAVALDMKTLSSLVRTYRQEAIPYLEQHLSSAPDSLLKQARTLGDETLYWSLFFLAGTSARWNADLREQIARPLSDERLAEALRPRTPPEGRRHAWRLENDVAQALYQRNASLFGPFLDQFANGGLAALELPQRIQAALATDQDRGALLREMEALAQAPGFSEQAPQWAPALYERDPLFFEPFLTNHLSSDQTDVITRLLTRAEAAGQDSFFTALYRKVAREDTWNKELAELAESSLPDDTVVQMLLRRQADSWLSLTDKTATALYRRDPARLGAFVREHAQQSWRQKEGYKQLREAARQRGDDDLYWALFRELADEREWQAEARRLLASDTPPERIADELTKRHPEHLWNVDTGVIADIVEKYGRAALPYVQEHLTWITRRAAPKLLSRIKKLGDENLYWPIFFKAGDSKQWNEALRELLAQPLGAEELAAQLPLRTPPVRRWGGWALEEDVALGLYRRDPQRFAPFLERFAHGSFDEALFVEAQAKQDEDFLDYLSLQLLRQIESWLYAAYPSVAALRWRKPDMKAQDKVQRTGRILTDRFDRLVAESPALYVRHTVAMLSRINAYEGWSFKRNLSLNPAFAYLYTRHRAAWLAAPDSLREVLESPNIYVQILGLLMLGEGGPDAAERVRENLLILRALLLGGAHLGTKKLALRALELAARQGETYAAQILPVVEEAAHLSGRRAVDQPAMVAFVRLQRDLEAQSA